MKKVLTSLMAAVLFAGYAHGASTVASYSTVQLVAEINEALADPEAESLTVAMVGTDDVIAITQSNVTGTAATPLIAVTDARTGTTADTADEASLVITAAGAYGLSVADGIVNIEGEIDSTGDITIDPAGNDLIVDATVDATAYTCDVAAGLDTKTAGELKIGAATATSVTIGDAGTTVEVASSDWSISTAGVIANAALSADQLTAGTTASAFDGGAITGLVNACFDDDELAAAKMATAVQTSLGLADTALQPGVFTVVGATNGVATAELTVANTLAASSVIVGWWSVTAGGAASAVNLTSFVASTGTMISEAGASTIVITTDAAGDVVIAATVSAATTNYVNWVQRDGTIKSSAVMEFDGP